MTEERKKESVSSGINNAQGEREPPCSALPVSVNCSNVLT